MKSLATLLVCSTVLCWSGAVHADFTLNAYNRLKDVPATSDKINTYVIGVGRGIFAANILLQARSQKPIFCMPKKLSLDSGLIESLLDQEIRSPSRGMPYSDDDNIELILLVAFETRFPCNWK